MEVIILAGGLGTRLRSEVRDVPKCMAPVAGQPFLKYILDYLTRFPVTRVILSVGYLRECVIEWIGGHKEEYPFNFDYAIETEPLGTGGGIRLAMEKAGENEIIVLNGDTFFDVDLEELCRRHSRNSAAITMALKPMRDFDRYGRVITDGGDGRVREFREKAHCDDGLINGGVYVISTHSDIFDGLPDKFSFESSVLETQCALGKLYGVVQDGYFIDIGVPEDYRKAGEQFALK